MSETGQAAGARSPAFAEEMVRARVWQAIKAGGDPIAVRDALDTLPPADRLRVADEVVEGLQSRASKTGDYAEMERVLPYLPGQGQMERRAIEAEASAGARVPAPLAPDDPRYQGMNFAGQKVEDDYRLAHRLGVVSRVESLAAEGFTARGIVERLGPALDRVEELARLNGEPHFAEKNKDDLVRAVRSKLDIPAVDDRTGFAGWIAARGVGDAPAPPPTERSPDAQAGAAQPRGADVSRRQGSTLSPDAQTMYQAVSKLLDTHHVIAAEELKPHLLATLAARESADRQINLTPDIRIVAGKPPVHTLDEMREVFAAVRDRAAVPSDRMAPETAAEVRESLQQQITGARSMVDLMKLYGQDETQRVIKSLDAHPDQQRLLTDAMEATGKRLLAEDRVKLGLDEPAERRPVRGVQDVTDGGQASGPDVPGITITRRGHNGAPQAETKASAPPERASDPLARDYDVREKDDERHYHRRDTGVLAIRATETQIHGVQRDAATIGAMLDLAVSRGWNDVQIKGDRETARTAWIEATIRGLKAEGYTPTRDDRHAADQRRAERHERELNTPERMPDRAQPRPGRAERHDRDDERYVPPKMELPSRSFGL